MYNEYLVPDLWHHNSNYTDDVTNQTLDCNPTVTRVWVKDLNNELWKDLLILYMNFLFAFFFS